MTSEAQRFRGHSLLPDAEVLAAVPALYATDGQPFASKVIHARFFVTAGSAQWLMAEYSLGDRIGFGYCDLGLGTPEWGYFSTVELQELLVVKQGMPIWVERDLSWTPRAFGELGM